MSKHLNTLANIQEIYFDVCDMLNGDSYQSMGYTNRREMLEEFQTKLERIESEFKILTGLEHAND
jgi:ATP-dependent DNA ligase